MEEGHKELLLRRSILKKQRVGKDERPDYSAGGKAKAAADDVKGVWQIARGGKEVIADYLQKVGLLPFTMKCNKCDKEMPRKLFWTGVNGKPRNWPCFQCNTTSCKHSNGKRRRVQMKFPSPCERQNTEDKDGKPAGEDGEDDEDGEDCEDDEDYGDDEDDEDDNKKDDKKTKNKKKKKKNTHTKLKMDELLILLWGCHTDLPVKYLSDFLDIDPSTITAYKQACVENAIVLVEELQAGMTLGGPGKEVEIDEFSVGLVHFVKTEAGSTIDKCAYQRLIGATERGSRKCYLRKLPLVVQDWLKPGQTVTLPSGVGNFTNKRAKKVPPPPPPLSNTELKAFLDEEFILLGKPKNPLKLTTDGAGAYRSMLDPTKPTFYWKNKTKDAEKCVQFAYVNHGKEEFTRVVVGKKPEPEATTKNEKLDAEMLSEVQEVITIANANAESAVDNEEDGEDEEDDDTELAWQRTEWKAWQAGTQKADGLWGILKRAIPVKRVRMMKRIREVQWQQWKHLIKDYPLKPFEVMLRSFARSRLLKEEAESMKDEEERRDIKEKADEEKKKKEEEDKREKEALQTIANNMRDKNQKSEKKNAILEEENRELKEQLHRLKLAEKKEHEEKQIITPIVRLAPPQSSQASSSFNSEQTTQLPSLPTPFSSSINQASQVSQPIVPAKRRSETQTEPEGQPEQKRPRRSFYCGPN